MKTKNEQLHIERRAQILKAAEACFVKSGFHKTSMRAICEKAQMSPGSVYQYFKNKEAIIEEFSNQEVDWVLSEIEKLKTTKDFKKALVDVSMVYIMASNDSQCVRVTFDIFAEATVNKNIQNILQKNNTAIVTALESIFTWAKKEERMQTPFTARELAQLWSTLIDGYIGKVIVDPQLDFTKIKKLLTKILKIVST